MYLSGILQIWCTLSILRILSIPALLSIACFLNVLSFHSILCPLSILDRFASQALITSPRYRSDRVPRSVQ